MAKTRCWFPLIALFLTLAPLDSRAQSSAATEPAAAAARAGVDVRSRVRRVCDALIQVDSYHCELTTLSRNPMRALKGGKKRIESELHVVREAGGLTCWSKQGGDQILARQGSAWIVLDGHDWLPCRKPEGAAWKRAFLADPTFLIKRLLHLLPKTEWVLGSAALDEKPVRFYASTIEGAEADRLVRCGALPDPGMANGLGMILSVAFGRGKGRKPDRTFEIRLFEAPKTKLPLKIEVRSFAKGGAVGSVKFTGPGGAVLGPDDEDEDDKSKKKKPVMTLVFEFSAIGKAKAFGVGKAGRKLLADQ